MAEYFGIGVPDPRPPAVSDKMGLGVNELQDLTMVCSSCGKELGTSTALNEELSYNSPRAMALNAEVDVEWFCTECSPTPPVNAFGKPLAAYWRQIRVPKDPVVVTYRAIRGRKPTGFGGRTNRAPAPRDGGSGDYWRNI